MVAPCLLHTGLGPVRKPVFRLGLSATYRPGERTIRAALDEGVNYLFAYGIDTQMNRVLRSLNADRRDRLVLAAGGYNWIYWHSSLKKSLDNALRRMGTDYLDVFHYLGVMKPEHFGPGVRTELAELRADPRVGAVAISCHDRKLAGQMIAQNVIDVAMIRYNAAHPGAETDIFPHAAAHNAGIVAYTATRWRRLLHPPRPWRERAATAGDCYRFVLSNPHVHVVLTAPSNQQQLRDNLRAARLGPLPEDDLLFMRRLGAHVHARAGWFMGN